MARYRVGTTDEIPPGRVKIVTVAGRSIGVYNVKGEFFALRNRCPHQGGPLCRGRIAGFLVSEGPGHYEYRRKGEMVRCPWHGWEFEIRTGQSWVDPGRVRVRSYPVTVEDGGEAERADQERDEETGYVKGPFRAERYDVEVEKREIYVEVG